MLVFKEVILAESEKEPQKVKDRIAGLLEKKYSRSQLISDFDFATSTVDTVIREYREGHDGNLPSELIANEDKAKAEAKNHDFQLPTTLKVGQGREAINPEAILNQCLMGDGDSGKWMLKGMMMLRAAQMMVLTDVEIMKGQAEAQSKAIQPILSLMEKSRADMDAAAQRAKESNQEIANRAAAGAAAQVMPSIDQLASQLASQKIASSPNPMAAMFTDAMQPYLGQMMGNIMGSLQPKPGQPGPQPGQSVQPQPESPVPGQQANQDEVKEAFGG